MAGVSRTTYTITQVTTTTYSHEMPVMPGRKPDRNKDRRSPDPWGAYYKGRAADEGYRQEEKRRSSRKRPEAAYACCDGFDTVPVEGCEVCLGCGEVVDNIVLEEDVGYRTFSEDPGSCDREHVLWDHGDPLAEGSGSSHRYGATSIGDGQSGFAKEMDRLQRRMNADLAESVEEHRKRDTLQRDVLYQICAAEHLHDGLCKGAQELYRWIVTNERYNLHDHTTTSILVGCLYVLWMPTDEAVPDQKRRLEMHKQRPLDWWWDIACRHSPVTATDPAVLVQMDALTAELTELRRDDKANAKRIRRAEEKMTALRARPQIKWPVPLHVFHGCVRDVARWYANMQAGDTGGREKRTQEKREKEQEKQQQRKRMHAATEPEPEASEMPSSESPSKRQRTRE